jgi:hypothetical protein
LLIIYWFFCIITICGTALWLLNVNDMIFWNMC